MIFKYNILNIMEIDDFWRLRNIKNIQIIAVVL